MIKFETKFNRWYNLINTESSDSKDFMKIIYRRNVLKLNDRLKYLQEKMEFAETASVSYSDICIFENELAELMKINKWLESECKNINRIYRNRSLIHKNAWYFVLNNITDIDFKYIKADVQIFYMNALTGTMPISVKNLYHGKSTKIYLNADIKENSILSIDANSVDYEVKL